MSKLGEILASILGTAFLSYRDGGRDCRLLVPGLTASIARQLHECLLEKGLTSYLVVGGTEMPSEELGFIRPIGLTSKRIGSFVVVANPGQLAHIQDSVRGSGGAVRSQVFSEEWPWIDDGDEVLRFEGPVVDKLVASWSHDEHERAWLREFVCKGLVPATKSSSVRGKLLFEEMLDFEPTLYPEISGVRQRFLYHCGVPRLSDELPKVKELIESITGLGREVLVRCQGNEDIREQVGDKVQEMFPSKMIEKASLAADYLLDGIGRSTTTGLGLLAFRSCWGPDKADSSHWQVLPKECIERLFEVEPRPKAEITCTVRCNRSHISDDCRKLATFTGEDIKLSIEYKLPTEEVAGHSWTVAVMNRARIIETRPLEETEGTVDIGLRTEEIASSYRRKIPLRIVVKRDDDPNADTRLDVHLCGESRPAFVLVQPGFHVVDATDKPTDDILDQSKKLKVEGLAHLYLFGSGIDEISVLDESESNVKVIETKPGHGIWTTESPVNTTARASDRIVRDCKFDSLSATVYFEDNDLETGEFTLEDELRLAVTHSKESQVLDLSKLFTGDSKKPYLRLGKINPVTKRRIYLAKVMESRGGWKPLLVDFLKVDVQEAISPRIYVNCLDSVDGTAFDSIDLSPQALKALEMYQEARDTVLQTINDRLELSGVALEHPIYASHPIYAGDASRQTEEALTAYLEAYIGILAHLDENRLRLEWLEQFVLTHLDCAVHWDESSLKDAVVFVGPWHPLVLAKRYMVQAALIKKAMRTVRKQDYRPFRGLTSLLGQVQGFRWLVGVAAKDADLDPMYVSATSDPGWHVAVKMNVASLAREARDNNLGEVYSVMRANYGLPPDVAITANESVVVTSLASYTRSYPSRRSVGMRIRAGYSEAGVLAAIDRHLHGVDEPTESGKQLPGGVRLYFQDKVGEVEEVRWREPPISAYHYADDRECASEEHPDIHVLAPSNHLSFSAVDDAWPLARGVELESVFMQPVSLVTEGQSLVPNSRIYENDRLLEGNEKKIDGLGGAFIRAVAKAVAIGGKRSAVEWSLSLPTKMDAPWVIVPGQGIDPGMLVKYVRDGASRKIQDRVLWDYTLDVTSVSNSSFTLSAIPAGFRKAVNGFFGQEDLASGFIVELGRFGISIGGEALKSGRHALGVIGLVGTVRLFSGLQPPASSKGSDDLGSVVLIMPTDSFASFFSSSDFKTSEQSGQRSDLLIVQLTLPDSDTGKLVISGCGVESKFTSTTYNNARAVKALEQASSTTQDFKALVDHSLDVGAMPERLGLLELIRFGLRIAGPSDREGAAQWASKEAVVYESLLAGKYIYRESRYTGVAVTTEQQLPGPAEFKAIGTERKGLWIRLTKDHWPGVSETEQIREIWGELMHLFEGRQALSESMKSNSNGEQILAPESPHQGHEPNGAGGGLLREVLLGADEGRSSVYWHPHSSADPLDNMNLMVTGSSGKGKTQFLKYLVCKIREQNKPVLLVDFKNDFASDSHFAKVGSIDSVFVSFDGLPYNPLIPYPQRHPGTKQMVLQIGQHIAGVASVLKRTYGLGPQQEVAVKNSISTAFIDHGLPATGSIEQGDNVDFPDFAKVGEILRESNPMAYNRLDPLFTLDLFRDQFKKVPFSSLLNRSVILDVSQIPSDAIKNALAQLVVLSAHSFYNSQSQAGGIRQMLMFDEAHRVLGSDYMIRLVRECRAYGVATVLSSQYPSDFPGEISASMATKVVHGNGRDGDKVRSIVQLVGCEGRESEVASLERFQAFLDNRHYPVTSIRTMNYPLYLIWERLQQLHAATVDTLSETEGIDTTMLPITNIIRELERMGLVEQTDGQVVLQDG